MSDSAGGTFQERYEAMRGTPAPPGSSHEVTVFEEPVVVDIAAGEKPSEGNRTAAPEPSKGTEAAPAPAGDKPAKLPNRGGFQTKISELETANSDLKRQLDEAKAALKPTAAPAPAPGPAAASPESKTAAPAPAPAAAAEDKEPQEADFKTYPEFLAALSRYNVRQELRASNERDQQAKANETLRKRFDAAAAKHADFHEVATKPIPVNQTTEQVLREVEQAGELFYYLGTHEAEAREIAGLSPIQTIRRLDAILGKFTADPPAAAAAPAAASPSPSAAPRVSGAPRPPTTAKASSMPSEPGTHEVKNIKDFTALRAKQGQRDAKRLMAARG